MTTIPEELVAALATDTSAAELFAALHRHERAAKGRWVRAGSQADERRRRAVQALHDLRAHDATRRANLTPQGAALFAPAPTKDQ